ncbi:sugar kinase [Maribellus sp. CM-23]|uniref:PfkB family carbohydrate kinase n=1 Tax=Maribellus sp. CM-23 TaxID=2781026 RepID=UPI001F2B0654|nr:PfkB family carbohydrate kinase [Maribellus sp. CM-23]MCE4566917.1 sugar kinase [Maribellus sp. CM-23]
MKFKGLFVGLTTVDIQYFVDVFPEANQKVKVTAPEMLVGGPATNAAIAFSALNDGAFLISSAGENSFSDLVRNDFEISNIDFTDLSAEKANQPVIATVVTSGNGDRNIFTHHPLPLETVYTPKQILDEINPEIVMMDGFYPEFSVALAREARSRKIPVVLDCGSWKPHLPELLPFVDIAICSSDFYPPFCSSPADVFDYLNELGIHSAAISRGGDSILFRKGKNESEIQVENVLTKDTLGAGDILHGAFCYYYLLEREFTSALTKASRVASFSCKFNGTRQWLTYLGDYLSKNT